MTTTQQEMALAEGRINTGRPLRRSVLNTLLITALLAGLYWISNSNYLLFHCLAELVSVVVAICIFIIIWNTRYNIENGYLIILGLAYPSVAVIEVLHTLSYKGMEIFANQSTDLPTQLWIAGRLLEAISLLVAMFFFNRRVRFAYAGVSYVMITGALIASIFVWHIFPVCYRDGSGLTSFKIYSEYASAAIFLFLFVTMLMKRREIDQAVLRWLCASFALSIATGVTFTQYLSVYGQANKLGHLLNIAAFYCMYKAIVEVGLTRPYDLLFRALMQRERALAEVKERLEMQAEELAAQNEELQTQAEELQQQAVILTQRQEALCESEERYRTTFDHAPVGIAHVGLDGQWLSTNRRMCEILGYSPDELAGMTFQDITYPEDLATDLALAEDLRVGRIATYTLEKRYIRKDGSLVWGNLTGALVHDAQGNPKHFIAVVEDINERRTIEARFERERALLSSAIDILPLPMEFCNPAGQCLRENAASRALFGASVGDCHASAFLTVDTRVPIAVEQWPINRALRGEIVSSEECLLHLPDGKEIPLLAHAAPVYVHEEIYAAVQALEDISALKLADKAKDEFLAILSHELLTPTTSMLGWSQVAQTGEIPAATRQALEVIERNARRQKHLVEDLLDMSRIIHGKIALQPEPTQLWQLVAQQVETIQQTAQDRHLQLCLQAPDDDLLPVEVDPVRIGQAISNLLNNAVKFTDAGGSITISGRQTGGWATIVIQDTGRGIPPEQLPGLFVQFQQLHRDKGTGGLGLGLALVKGFVELHGGKVFAHSNGVGQGSTFSIMLPCLSDAG